MSRKIRGVTKSSVKGQCFTYSRWDLQHYRAKKQREELEEKYKQREEARLKGRKVVEQEQKSCDETLLPDCLCSKLNWSNIQS